MSNQLKDKKETDKIQELEIAIKERNRDYEYNNWRGSDRKRYFQGWQGTEEL